MARARGESGGGAGPPAAILASACCTADSEVSELETEELENAMELEIEESMLEMFEIEELTEVLLIVEMAEETELMREVIAEISLALVMTSVVTTPVELMEVYTRTPFTILMVETYPVLEMVVWVLV